MKEDTGEGQGGESASLNASESQSQMRGSSLLLTGRILAAAVGYGTQILIIRYLAKADYGAFAYALSIVALLQAAVQLGLDRGLSRYLPIYDERHDTGSILGSIAFVTGTATSLGAAVVAFYWIARSLIEGTLISDPLAVAVLAVLIVLAPIEALDNILMTVLAAFRMTGTIFVRRDIVAPLLKLTVVVLLIAFDAEVGFLAAGYVLAGFLGLVVFGTVLVRYLSARRARDGSMSVRYPVRELVGFSIPLLTTDLVFMALNATDSIMLEAFGSTTDVASLRAVQPTARLNQLVLTAFGVLYIPYIARLYARGHHDELGRRYWETTNWVVVLSLPVLSLCLMFPIELTQNLLGDQYRESAVILGILSSGYFIHAMFGYNGMTLNVYRKIPFLVAVNLSAVVANVALNLALIPPFGPLGAALATAATFQYHNLAKQYGVRKKAGLPRPPTSTWRLYRMAVLMAAAAATIGFTGWLPFSVRLIIWILMGLAVLVVARRELKLDDAFPGLRKVPLVNRLFR